MNDFLPIGPPNILLLASSLYVSDHTWPLHAAQWRDDHPSIDIRCRHSSHCPSIVDDSASDKFIFFFNFKLKLMTELLQQLGLTIETYRRDLQNIQVFMPVNKRVRHTKYRV